MHRHACDHAWPPRLLSPALACSRLLSSLPPSAMASPPPLISPPSCLASACQGFTAAKIDPKFLDPKHVFKELGTWRAIELGYLPWNPPPLRG